MQTFLPYSDFFESAKCLHPKHLGNQYYREGMTLLNGGWKNHPAHKMWRGYEKSLTEYLLFCQKTLQLKGKWYGKTAVKLRHIRKSLPDTGYPPWLGNKEFHASHRSNLLRKDKEKGWNWYIKIGWPEEETLPYVWPI